HSACARRTRAMCPSCRAPIVGTSPTVAPAARQPATTPRRSATVRTTGIFAPAATAAPAEREVILCSRPRAEAVFGPREAARADIGRIGRRRLADRIAELGIALDEL